MLECDTIRSFSVNPFKYLPESALSDFSDNRVRANLEMHHFRFLHHFIFCITLSDKEVFLWLYDIRGNMREWTENVSGQCTVKLS
jgi:hypothetical protein